MFAEGRGVTGERLLIIVHRFLHLVHHGTQGGDDGTHLRLVRLVQLLRPFPQQLFRGGLQLFLHQCKTLVELLVSPLAVFFSLLLHITDELLMLVLDLCDLSFMTILDLGHLLLMTVFHLRHLLFMQVLGVGVLLVEHGQLAGFSSQTHGQLVFLVDDRRCFVLSDEEQDDGSDEEADEEE